MRAASLLRTGLAVGIILLFTGTCILPSCAQYIETSYQPCQKTTITVDDDGDGDYTSVSDAVNHSHPGDIIEVYSGTYVEDDILIRTPEITLRGIPHELGGGNDTGEPLIVRKGYMQIIKVIANMVTISGLIMQDNLSERKVLYQGHFIDVYSVNGCLISNNTIQNGTDYSVGIECDNTTNVQIIDNIIRNMNWDGILFTDSTNASVCGNIIIHSEDGIYLESSETINITKNKISGCGIGIALSKSRNIPLYLNTLESNSLGSSLELSTNNIIKHNNFINNSQDAAWMAVKVPIIQRWKSIRNSWIENYWSDWIRIGPKLIPGLIFIFLGIIPGGDIQLPIGIPLILFQLDRHPAQKPYDYSETS
jgi:parallel beta-helix repeat protein